MKKLIKWLMIGFSGILLMVGILFLFIYFSVSDNIEINEKPIPFNNQQTILRLDSVQLSPEAMTESISDILAKANVQGFAVSIINSNELVYQRYFGSADQKKGIPLSPGTIFYGASFSKTIFAELVVQLAEEKIIHLDTPLYKYLEQPLYTYKTNSFRQLFGANAIDYSDLEKDERYKLITARMCLSHTTGLPNWRWIEEDKKLKILFDPGSRYRYSGEGLFLLQFVIEKVTNQDLNKLITQRIFQPLSMTSSSYVWERGYEGHYCVGHDVNGNTLGIAKRNVANAAGSLSTTLEDYTRFFQSVLKQEKPSYKELIEPQVRIRSKQQFGPNAMIDTNENDSIRLSYGLGFGLYFTPYGKAFFKEGHLEGWQHYAVGFPDKGTALIMMSNSDNTEAVFNELINLSIGNRYTPWFWEGYIPARHSQ